MIHLHFFPKDTYRLSKYKACIYYTIGQSTEQLNRIYLKRFTGLLFWVFKILKFEIYFSETGNNRRIAGVETWYCKKAILGYRKYIQFIQDKNRMKFIERQKNLIRKLSLSHIYHQSR